jgi:hypothetical protein
LSGGVNFWLESAFNLKILTISTAMCKIFPFLSYTMLHYSVTIIVILTADKLYAVSSPFKAFERKFAKKKLVIIAFLALFVCCLINSHFLYSLNIFPMNLSSNSINKNNSQNFTKICINNKWKSFYVNYWIYIDATVYSFLPFTLITVFNALIIIRLIKEGKKSFELQQTVFGSQYSVFKIKNRPSRTEIKKVNHQKRRMAIVECNRNKSLLRVVMSHEQKKHHTINTKLSILTILLITILFCILTMPIVILKIINENYIGKLSKLNKIDKFLVDQDFEEKFNRLK